MKRDAFQIAKELVCVIVFIAPGSNIDIGSSIDMQTKL